MLPTSASGYSVNSRSSAISVPQSDSLYSVSSGGSSISSTSASSNNSDSSCSSTGAAAAAAAGNGCCGGRCLGAYPRQPNGGALRRSQQHAMKLKLQEYCHPQVNRLPPIREAPGGSPMHGVAPPSTRIRCETFEYKKVKQLPEIVHFLLFCE